MQELHIAVRKDRHGTYMTTLLDAPPRDQNPAEIYEMFGYRVGVYPAQGLSLERVEVVVRDVVRRLASDKRS
jgi:hypothetical protein